MATVSDLCKKNDKMKQVLSLYTHNSHRSQVTSPVVRLPWKLVKYAKNSTTTIPEYILQVFCFASLFK